jgi:hypothetical protein
MPVPRLPDGAAMMEAFWDYLFASFVFGYFVNLAGAWYVGDRIAARNRFDRRLSRFTLPDAMVWPLIGAWAVVLMGRFAKLGYLRALALNAGLILLALYAVQGLAIIETLLARMARSGATRQGAQARRWPVFGLILVLLVPALTVLALVVIPLVGVSEIWVKYRIERKEETDEGQGDT